MSNLRCGGDSAELWKQYESKPNSSLVLDNDDHVVTRKKKDRDTEDDTVFGRESKRRIWRGVSVLTDKDDVFYKPKSEKTRAAYESMLSLIQHQLGKVPPSIVYSAADKILAILKNESLKHSSKKMEIEKLFTSNVFDRLVSIGKLITDYQECVNSASVDYPVQFEEHEEEEDDDDDDDAKEGKSLNVEKVDAHWLQRKLFEGYEEELDPRERQELAEGLLKVLADGNDMDVENKLLVHLRVEKLSLVKFLLYNRLKVVWCTRLARARNQKERNRIGEEMMGLGPEFASIVLELHHPKNSNTAKQKKASIALTKSNTTKETLESLHYIISTEFIDSFP